MDWKPEDLYPKAEVPMPPLEHQIGKYLLASVAGIFATVAAHKAYDFGLGAFRHFRNQ